MSQGYSNQRCNVGGRFHTGVDYRDAGSRNILAAAPGTVIIPNEINFNHGLGNTVILKHTLPGGRNIYTLYGHLQSIDVIPNQCVLGGQKIGVMGATGSGSGGTIHLHFEVKDLGVLENPSGGSPCGPRTCEPGTGNKCWGYTPGNPALYGYHNPSDYLGIRRIIDGSSEIFRVDGGPPIHPNGTLIKQRIIDTVYVLQNGQKRPISSPQVLRSLYQNGGFDFKDVVIVAADEIQRYPTGSGVFGTLPSNNRGHPDGRLIRQVGSTEISIVTNNGGRRPFDSEATFLGLGYLFCNVVEVSNYSSYTPAGTVNLF